MNLRSSRAPLWMRCPAVANLREFLAPAEVQNAVAIRGSQIHEEIHGAYMENRTSESANFAVSYLDALADGCDIQFREQQLFFIFPDELGDLKLSATPDFIAVNGETVVCADTKTGFNNFKISAFNPQLIVGAYLLHKVMGYEFKTYDGHIISDKTALDREIVPFSEIVALVENAVKLILQERKDKKYTFVPGTHCKDYYCKFASTCTAARSHFIERMQSDRTDYDAAMYFNKVADDVKSEIKQRFDKGEKIPGLVFYERRNPEKWEDSDALTLAMVEQGLTQFLKPLSPAQLLHVAPELYAEHTKLTTSSKVIKVEKEKS